VTPRFHPLRIAEVRPETADSVSLRFEVPPALAAEYVFVQGQHVTLRAQLGGQEVRRSYSICSGVDDAELRVAIKHVPGGLFSGFATRALHAGDVVDVLTPEGRFHTPLDAAHAKHYAAFAAGSGITPVLSLIKTTLAREPRSRFTLLYGNRRQGSVMFHETLEDLKDRYMRRFVLYQVFSREHQEVALFNGRLDRAKVLAFTENLLPVEAIDEAFICGPGAMIDEVEATLLERGLALSRIHVERFGVPGTAVQHRVEEGDAARATVEMVLDGVRRDVEFFQEDPSVLDAALRAGIELPYSCKGGMCCTCRAKVLSGKVRMDKNYSLEPRDLEAGFVLTCQAHPLTERVVISFDER
jgi:ring-1,2-phenylacetyl-CoA epoxidase subunit PaaE